MPTTHAMLYCLRTRIDRATILGNGQSFVNLFHQSHPYQAINSINKPSGGHK